MSEGNGWESQAGPSGAAKRKCESAREEEKKKKKVTLEEEEMQPHRNPTERGGNAESSDSSDGESSRLLAELLGKKKKLERRNKGAGSEERRRKKTGRAAPVVASIATPGDDSTPSNSTTIPISLSLAPSRSSTVYISNSHSTQLALNVPKHPNLVTSSNVAASSNIPNLSAPYSIPHLASNDTSSASHTPSLHTSFKPTLLKFLSYLSPSLTLYCELFLHAGLTNRSRINNLLCMEKDELEEFFDFLGAGVQLGGGVVIEGLKPFFLKSVLPTNLERVRREMKEGLRVVQAI
ncbi:hypothetical protein P7C70_g1849, partial [Phenoliferia sp. Uapishka_3]